jgi:hypothetical protein
VQFIDLLMGRKTESHSFLVGSLVPQLLSKFPDVRRT